MNRKTGVLIAAAGILLAGCGNGSKELFGVYESRHAGIDFETGQAISDEFDYKYSFLLDGACVYYDGQKDMMYYTCSYQKTGDDTYSTEVVLRSSDSKTLQDSITVKNGKTFEAVNADTSETVTFTKSDEKLDTQSVIDVAEYDDVDKQIVTAMVNFCKDPENHEYYRENSSIPTIDSTIKGAELIEEDGEYYYYSIKDKNDGTDMLRAYAAMVMAKTDCTVQQKNGIVIIDGGSGRTMMMGAGNDSKMGFVFMVTFM